MLKTITTASLLLSLNLSANEMLECPNGVKEVTGSRIVQGIKAMLHGCENSKGKLHGTAFIFVNGITVDKCTYNNGLEDGACLSWYLTGEKQRSMHFKNGKLHGETKGWYKNGVMELQAFYKNGKPIGEWKQWNKKGELVNIVEH